MARKSTKTPQLPVPSYVPVTPDLAESWLRANDINRKIREAKVRQYATDMRNGWWGASPDAICFAPDGTLLNGQHRLHAVIESGVESVVMLVLNGVPVEAMKNMDSGAARTASDMLGMRGEGNPSLTASMARWLILFTEGRLYMDRKDQAVSHSEILAFVDANPDIRIAATAATSVRHRVLCPPTPIGCSYWMIAQANGLDVADSFFERLASRTDEPAGSPVIALDDRLRAIHLRPGSLPTRNLVYVIVRAFNLLATGKTTKRVQEARTDREFRIPEIEQVQVDISCH